MGLKLCRVMRLGLSVRSRIGLKLCSALIDEFGNDHIQVLPSYHHMYQKSEIMVVLSFAKQLMHSLIRLVCTLSLREGWL